MILEERLLAHARSHVGEARAAEVCLGLGYTLVILDDGRAGLAWTPPPGRGKCRRFDGLSPLAGRPAAELLTLLMERDPVAAAVGLAAANAVINRREEAHRGGDVLEQVGIRDGDEVAMVGHFAPLVRGIRDAGGRLRIFERRPAPGSAVEPAEEAPAALRRCQVALITATSLINHTLSGLLSDSPMRAREVVLLGASTPLVPGVFRETPFTLLSGVVVCSPEEALRVVKEAGGTRQLRGAVEKVNARVPPAASPEQR